MLHTPTLAETGPLPARLDGRYARQLATAQKAVLAMITGAAAITFYLFVIAEPARLLWPGASSGTPQHWIAGIVIGVLLLAVVTLTVISIYGDVTLTHDLVWLGPFDRYQLAREGRWLWREIAATQLLLAAVLTGPLVPALATAWQHNLPADVPVLGPAVLLRLAPAAVLQVMQLVTTVGLRVLVTRLEAQQHAAARAGYETRSAPATTSSEE